MLTPVYFIGAGPGDPELLTVKALRLIESADFILYSGSLINPAVLRFARPGIETVDAVNLKLAEQIERMSSAYLNGKRVVRLISGDPSIYGTLQEQAYELEKYQIPYRIVPGVSSALAAAASLGIEFTVPNKTQTIIFTRLEGKTPTPEKESLRGLASHQTSIVIFLSVGMITQVVAELLAAGYTEHTPVAVVYRASWSDEKVLRGTLANISAQVQRAEITHQALIVVSPALPSASSPSTHETSFLYDDFLNVPSQRQKKTAILSLTRLGTETGNRLKALLNDAVLFAPQRFLAPQSSESEDMIPYMCSVRQVLQSAFQEYQNLVCIMASGIVMRDLAPLLQNKHSDPGVVIMDERGQYAVSLLGGHYGGANKLALHIEALLGCKAVLTTASDNQSLPSIDLLGQEQGWHLASGEHMTALIAALVNGQTVGVVQDVGDENWLPDPMPGNLKRYSSIEQMQAADPKAALIITDRIPSPDLIKSIPIHVVYHPRCLVAGIGCNRATPAAEILAALQQTCAENGLAWQSISALATIVEKQDEEGLLEICQVHNWQLHIFTHEEIESVTSVPNPSQYTQRILGVQGVAEPASILASGSNMTQLLVEKRKFQNVTIAIARLYNAVRPAVRPVIRSQEIS